MSEITDSTRSVRPIPVQQQEEKIQQQQRERTRSAAEDRVSLGEQEAVNETYGPGLKVATADELLRNLVIKTLQDQGLSLEFIAGDTEVNFNTMTQEEAQARAEEEVKRHLAMAPLRNFVMQNYRPVLSTQTDLFIFEYTRPKKN